MLILMPSLGLLERAVSLLVKQHPSVVLKYAQSYCKSAAEWQMVIDCVLAELESANPNAGQALQHVSENVFVTWTLAKFQLCYS